MEVRLTWDNNGEKIVTLDNFSKQNTIKTILIDPSIRKLTKNFDVYAGHGKNSQWVSFRINFLIGESGGKSIDKGTSNCKNANISPVDCVLGSGETVVTAATTYSDSDCKLFPTNISGHSEDNSGARCSSNHNTSQSTTYGNTAYATESKKTSSGKKKRPVKSNANSRGSCHNPPWSYTKTHNCPWKGWIRIHRDCSNRDSLSPTQYSSISTFGDCLKKCKGQSGLRNVSYYDWSNDCFCLKKKGAIYKPEVHLVKKLLYYGVSIKTVNHKLLNYSIRKLFKK